jgi:hypothetical protein
VDECKRTTPDTDVGHASLVAALVQQLGHPSAQELCPADDQDPHSAVPSFLAQVTPWLAVDQRGGCGGEVIASIRP